MANPRGFLDIARENPPERPIDERQKDYKKVGAAFPHSQLKAQAERCMDCFIPFCHDGCPVNNIIPDWNNLVFRDQWQRANKVLHSTNNFPAITGKICPGPCEAACTLNIDDNAVTIKSIEDAIAERGWDEGWNVPIMASSQTGYKIAIVGSGPAGMAASQQLVRQGHKVTLFEKNDRIGGLPRYGIPDFKLPKDVIDRYVEQMAAEGVEFVTNTEIGAKISAQELFERGYHRIGLTGGSEIPNDLNVPGRELRGVHFAMEFLPQQNKRNAGDSARRAAPGGAITAKGKHVVVIGGGDTGSDCIGTSTRQGAASITQLEIMPRPPDKEDKGMTWPNWPQKFRTSSSQEEGCERLFSVLTKRLIGKNGKVVALEGIGIEWHEFHPDGRPKAFRELPGTEFTLKADLILVAMGFRSPRQEMLKQFGVALDLRNNVLANTVDYKTSIPRVFAGGDMRRGQSLVVWAIREGRQMAAAMDYDLTGRRNEQYARMAPTPK